MVDGISSPEMAEALVLQRAVTVAVDHGYHNVIFASDCLSLIQRIFPSNPDHSSMGTVVSEIKKKVTSFVSVTFRHMKRSLNEATHILARSCEVTNLGFIFLFCTGLFILML
jgi:hypothetical protein